MFFGLTNLPVTFQATMNNINILWNLINMGEVVAFMDNVLVETEDKNIKKLNSKPE